MSTYTFTPIIQWNCWPMISSGPLVNKSFAFSQSIAPSVHFLEVFALVFPQFLSGLFDLFPFLLAIYTFYLAC